MIQARTASTTETMSFRERFDALIAGDEMDRFPVWLKMTNPTWKTSQPEPYCTMGAVELLEEAGCDLLVGNGIKVHKTPPHAEIAVERRDGVRRTVARTPDGTLVGEAKVDPYTQSWHPTKFMGGRREEAPKLRWLFRDTEYTVDAESVDRAKHARAEAVRRGDRVTKTGMGPSPLMALVEHLVGPVDTAYHLADMPEVMEELMEEMHRDNLRMLRARMPHEQADTLWMTENTSTTLISPTQFRRYVAPRLREYAEIILAAGVVPVHHMCGTLNALLEDIDALPARANEAFTTRPLGDVSLTEGRTRMPSKALIGGTNATLWMQPAETIIQTVAEDLATCPDRRRIFLTSAGVLPACVSMDKARTVVAGLKRL
ncbi:MAG: uroporphyrinogen decarboxylase family protein [Planctomycetota bacterium]